MSADNRRYNEEKNDYFTKNKKKIKNKNVLIYISNVLE